MHAGASSSSTPRQPGRRTWSGGFGPASSTTSPGPAPTDFHDRPPSTEAEQRALARYEEELDRRILAGEFDGPRHSFEDYGTTRTTSTTSTTRIRPRAPIRR